MPEILALNKNNYPRCCIGGISGRFHTMPFTPLPMRSTMPITTLPIRYPNKRLIGGMFSISDIREYFGKGPKLTKEQIEKARAFLNEQSDVDFSGVKFEDLDYQKMTPEMKKIAADAYIKEQQRIQREKKGKGRSRRPTGQLVDIMNPKVLPFF